MLRLSAVLILAASLAAPTHNDKNHVTGGNSSAAQSKADPSPAASLGIPTAVQSDVQRIARALEAANHKQPIKAENDRAERDIKAQEAIAWWTPFVAVAAILEMVVTSAGVVLVGFTLRATREVVSETKRAADAAVAAGTQSERHARQQLRAYVVRSSFKTTPLCPGSIPFADSWDLSLVWKNTGQTPAYRAVTRIVSKQFTGDLDPNFDFPDGGSVVPGAPGDTVIGPGGELESHLRFPVDKLQRAQKGKYNIYIWGWIEYDDVFDDSPRRRTETCIRLDIIGDPIEPANCTIEQVFKGPFNGADEYCYRQPQT
ncbi:MAG TPA: hypothetical protein VGG10_01330 [Rhizomicrobium sp.]|jgi:hypothetical protein